MELLIVGAGAVGSVYGNFITHATPSDPVRVTYLIKPKHRKSLENGFNLYYWKGRKPTTIQFKEFSVLDSFEAVAAKKFDAVLITLPSDKMRDDVWLDSLLKAVKTAQIWSLQPNLNDRIFIRERMKVAGISDPSNRLVFGSIPIISYLAPMPGETFSEPGYAFYIPPGSKAAWSSESPVEAGKVADAFTAGGLPSKVTDEKDSSGILPESLLRSLVAGLELSEWSLDRLLNGPNLSLVTSGIREMSAIQAKIAGIKDPSSTIAGRLLSCAFGVNSAIRLARLVLPFDLESFLRVHFTKVDGQMHLGIDEMIEAGKKLGLTTASLKLLRGRKAS